MIVGSSSRTWESQAKFYMWKLKNLGIFVLLLAIIAIASGINGSFVDPANLKTLIRDTSLYGLISLGVAMVIITGGIDLSIGSMIALCGVMLVQVVNIRYEAADFSSQIRSIASADSDPAAAADAIPPAVRDRAGDSSVVLLADPPPPLRDGDRLVYRTTIGESFLNVSGTIDHAGRTFLTSRDSVRMLNAGTTVSLSQIRYTPPVLACAMVLAFAAMLGLIHGLLITRVHLQPFVVTLCGLLIYRGLARVWTGDDQVGLQSALSGFKSLVTGAAFSLPLPGIGKISGVSESWTEIVWVDFPVTGVLLAIVAVLGWLFLNRTVWGRHLLAAGENEQAARYSGVATDKLIVLAYVVCGFLAGLAGILFTLEWNSVQPGSSGNFYELYAIAAAVLGGCSLRGGRGAVLGVIAGAAVMRCLYKAIVVLGIPQEWEMVIIGLALLSSVALDEAVLRYVVRSAKRGSKVNSVA